MSIEDFRNVVKKKNYDQSFETLADTLETIGGSSAQQVTFDGGYNGYLPDFTSERIEVTTTAIGSSDPIIMQMPLGAQHGQKITIEWKVDQTDSAVDLFIGGFGYGMYDPTHVFQLSDMRFNVGSYISLKWDTNYGHWVLIDYYSMSNAPNIQAGKTVYNIEFTDYGVGLLSKYIIMGEYDVVIEVSSDSEEAGEYTIDLADGNYYGQRIYVEVNLSTSETLNVLSTSGFDENSTLVSAFSVNESGKFLLEWKGSTSKWVVLDYDSGVVFV
jgi:hypothetical protein